MASCEIGLGAAIDTEAPVISIDYPPTNSTIMGTFLLAGSCDDDMGVSEIEVQIKNSNNQVTGTYSASIDGSRWSIYLNGYSEGQYYNGWELADGSYEIDVTAYDEVNHSSGTASKSIIIDNTPPVLVLTNPTSVGGTNPRNFGQTVQLVGTLSESCKTGISNLKVKFYNYTDGTLLFDSDFQNITDMSNANPLVIAQYYPHDSEPEEGTPNYQIWENYKTLFTDSGISNFRNGTNISPKQFYFSLTASDAARYYKSLSEPNGSGQGNTTQHYFRGTSEMSKLISSNNPNYSGFTALSLQNFLNKTEPTYRNDQNLTDILEEASTSSVIETVTEPEETLTFTINPQNNPTYNVSGFDIITNLTDDTHENGFLHYYPGSTINVSIACGLDLTNLKTSSISIFYQKKTGAGEAEAPKELLWTWNESVAVQYAMQNSSINEETARANIAVNPEAFHYTPTTATENTDALSITTSLSTTEILNGKAYNFILEGEDINDQDILPAVTEGFGFYTKTSTAVPKIKIGEQCEADYKNLYSQTAINDNVLNSNLFKFDGEVVSVDDMDKDKMTYSVTIQDSDNESNTATQTISGSDACCTFSKKAGTSSTYLWSFYYTPNTAIRQIIENGSGLYALTVEFRAVNGGGNATQNRTYILDSAKPVISDNLVLSGGFKKNSTIYINNTSAFDISGTTTDNYLLNKIKYEITQSGVTSPVSDEKDSTISWSFTNVDITNYSAISGDKDAVLKIISTDKAGNTAEKSFNLKFDTTAPTGKHLYDKNNKDLIFRVGTNDNVLSELSDFNPDITALDA